MDRRIAERRDLVGSVAAAAMIELELGPADTCVSLRLHSMDRTMAGEFALFATVERTLADLETAGGRLVTCGGARDLSLLRLAAMRHRAFRLGSSGAWLRDVRDAHDDVREMIDPAAALGHRSDKWIAALCGCRVRAVASGGPRRVERKVAEFEAVRTLIAYCHLLAERQRSVEPLATGVAAIADMISARSGSLPHLVPILSTKLFETFAPAVF